MRLISIVSPEFATFRINDAGAIEDMDLEDYH